MGFSSGGGGSGNIAGSTDVALNNPSNNEVLTYDASASKWKNSVSSGAELRWDANARTWPARPQSAPFGITYISTNDPTATIPTDANLKVGDIWRRHPDAS